MPFKYRWADGSNEQYYKVKDTVSNFHHLTGRKMSFIYINISFISGKMSIILTGNTGNHQVLRNFSDTIYFWQVTLSKQPRAKNSK